MAEFPADRWPSEDWPRWTDHTANPPFEPTEPCKLVVHTVTLTVDTTDGSDIPGWSATGFKWDRREPAPAWYPWVYDGEVYDDLRGMGKTMWVPAASAGTVKTFTVTAVSWGWAGLSYESPITYDTSQSDSWTYVDGVVRESYETSWALGDAGEGDIMLGQPREARAWDVQLAMARRWAAVSGSAITKLPKNYRLCLNRAPRCDGSLRPCYWGWGSDRQRLVQCKAFLTAYISSFVSTDPAADFTDGIVMWTAEALLAYLELPTNWLDEVPSRQAVLDGMDDPVAGESASSDAPRMAVPDWVEEDFRQSDYGWRHVPAIFALLTKTAPGITRSVASYEWRSSDPDEGTTSWATWAAAQAHCLVDQWDEWFPYNHYGRVYLTTTTVMGALGIRERLLFTPPQEQYSACRFRRRWEWVTPALWTGCHRRLSVWLKATTYGLTAGPWGYGDQGTADFNDFGLGLVQDDYVEAVVGGWDDGTAILESGEFGLSSLPAFPVPGPSDDGDSDSVGLGFALNGEFGIVEWDFAGAQA